MSDGSAHDPVPRAFNMAAYCIGRAARETPDKKALLVFETADPRGDNDAVERWSYRDLENAVLKIAGGLASRGLKRGDRVAIHLGNDSASALLFFGAIAGGYIALPLSDQLTPHELRALLDDSGASLIATSSPLDDAALPAGICVLSRNEMRDLYLDAVSGRTGGPPAPYAATSAGDPAFLIYTSGTTSRPKGVLHAHRSAWGRRPMYQGWYGITPNDRVLHAGNFNWTYTLGVGLTDPWANGATAIVYTGDKRPEFWPNLISKTGATLFAAVPGVYRQILKYAKPSSPLGKLRHGLVAGETPPPGLFEDWRAATGCELYEALGMSEISTYISTNPSVPRRDGTIGKAQGGRRVAVLPVEAGSVPLAPGEQGLIAVHRSDPGLMLGYWNRPEEEHHVLRGEWFTGGDIGAIDADGYVTHLGRANELMNAGGYRVSPLEIEAVLAAAPGIASVACAEVDVQPGVSVIAAFVVPQSSAHQVQIADTTLHAYCRERLAAYKCPKLFVVTTQLPRTANGKIQRRALAANFAKPNGNR